MEILFENPILWIVLLGVISTLIRGKKREEEQKTRPNPVENRRNQKSGAFEEIKELVKEVNRSFQEETQSPSQTLQKETHKKLDQAQELIDTVSNSQNTNWEETAIPNEAEVIHKKVTRPTKSEKQLKADESKLVDAVIWSEILGPPRAKNPYFRNKAQRK